MSDAAADLKEKTQGLVTAALWLEAPHCNIGPLLGAEHPIYIKTEGLYTALLDHEPPGIRLELNENTSVAVTCSTTGQVMATLDIVHF